VYITKVQELKKEKKKRKEVWRIAELSNIFAIKTFRIAYSKNLYGCDF